MSINLTKVVNQSIKKGSVIKINGYLSNLVVINIDKDISEDSLRGDFYTKTFMECIYKHDLGTKNASVLKFNIKDLGSMSGDIEIKSSDITFIEQKQLKKEKVVIYSISEIHDDVDS